MKNTQYGDIVTIAVGGDYGKPRPALVIQSDVFQALPSVTVLRLSSEIIPASLVRVTLDPTPENGLLLRSQVMIDKAVTVPRTKIGKWLGHADEETMESVRRSLALFLDLNV